MNSIEAPYGILLINKPKDWTSFDVVAKVRRIFAIKKVGHAGTLDPMATGVLIVLVGKATKWSDQLLAQDKQYLATIKFGQQTDTGDAEGAIITDQPTRDLTEAQVQSTLTSLVGTREQMVPAFAAVKVGGKKLYELARAGTPMVSRPVRQISINALSLVEFTPDQLYPSATVKVDCSKGTYIRVLAEEIAEKLGTVAHLTALERTASGSYSIDQTVTLEELIRSNNPTQYLQKLPMD